MPTPPCPTCQGRCPCDPEAGESCGHYGCPGRPRDELPTCPGAEELIAAYARSHQQAEQFTRILKARRATNSHAYALNLARQADAAHAEATRAITRHSPPVES